MGFCPNVNHEKHDRVVPSFEQYIQNNNLLSNISITTQIYFKIELNGKFQAIQCNNS